MKMDPITGVHFFCIIGQFLLVINLLRHFFSTGIIYPLVRNGSK